MIINYNFPCFTLEINIIIIVNRIGGVIISVLASTVIDRGFESDRVISKTIKLIFVASPLSTQH
jgi:hypothetical protein